jgi:hypothetical protein
MTRLIEIRNQEMLCRERALTEPERKEFWLAQADEWAQRALNEIASDLQAQNRRLPSQPVLRTSITSPLH